jgi:hypothetical protein
MGKSWSNRSAEAMLLALRAQGLLEKDLTCIASIAHQVALDAAESEQGPLIVGALARVLPRSHRERPDNFFWNYHSYELANDRDLFRKVRLAVYANADNEFTRLRQIFDREKREDGQAILASHLAKLPADIAWIERRTLLIRDALLTGMVNALLENGIVRADIAAAIAHFTQSGVAPSPALNKALVWCDILAEKFETARERIAALPPEDSVAGPRSARPFIFSRGVIPMPSRAFARHSSRCASLQADEKPCSPVPPAFSTCSHCCESTTRGFTARFVTCWRRLAVNSPGRDIRLCALYSRWRAARTRRRSRRSRPSSSDQQTIRWFSP